MHARVGWVRQRDRTRRKYGNGGDSSQSTGETTHPAQRRTAKISLSLTPDEKQRVINAADATGRVLSDFVRGELLQSVAEVEKRQAGK